MAISPREIASGFIRLFVRKDGLKADLQDAERQVDASTSKMQGAAGKTSGSFSQMGKTIREAVGAPLIAAITGLVAALGVVVTVTNRLIRAWGEAQSINKELAASINETTKAANAYIDSLQGIERTAGDAVTGRIRQQIASIQDEIDRLTDPNSPSLAGFAEAIVGKRIPALRDEQERLLRQIASVERAERKKAEEERRTSNYQAQIDEYAEFYALESKLEAFRDRVRSERQAKELADIQARYAAETEAATAFAALQQQLIQQVQQSLSGVTDGGGLRADLRIITSVIEEVRDSLRG